MRHLHVRPLQSSDNRCPQVHTLHHANQSLRNSVAPHNPSKDIHKNGCDFRVRGDEVEGLLDGLGGGAAADVEEVCGLAAVELDDVHGGHGEAGAVDEAADVAVEFDEVEAMSVGWWVSGCGYGGERKRVVLLSSFDFIGVFLGGISPRENLLLPEFGVVVEP